MATQKQLIEACLQKDFSPIYLSVEDDSAKHKNHAGAQQGAGHFKVTIVAECFMGQGLLGQHRLVYQSLAGLMANGIHALSLQTYSPNQWKRA